MIMIENKNLCILKKGSYKVFFFEVLFIKMFLFIKILLLLIYLLNLCISGRIENTNNVPKNVSYLL